MQAKPHYLTHLAFVDALRAFAAMGVILVHTEQWSQAQSPFLKLICQHGAQGVQFFFVVSAFALFLSWSHRRQHEYAVVTNFFIRRFCRIAPLFYVGIAFYVYLWGFAPRYWAPDGINGSTILLTATFTNGWRPETIASVVPGGWAIAAEVTFYLCLPMLFRLVRSREHALGFLVGAVCLRYMAQRYLLPHLLISPCPADRAYLNHSFGVLWYFSQLPVFAVGILLYFLFLNEQQAPNTRLGWAYTALFALLAVSSLHWSTFLDLFPQHLASGVSCALLALGLFHTRCSLFINPVLCFIGKTSYSLYICHFAVLHLFGKIWPDGLIPGSWSSTPLAFILVLIVSCVAASITYALIELPGVSLGMSITRRIEHWHEQKRVAPRV